MMDKTDQGDSSAPDLATTVQALAVRMLEQATEAGQAGRLSNREVMTAAAIALGCMVACEPTADDRTEAVEIVTDITRRTAMKMEDPAGE
jgi:hypothetical protein